jgi:hypothetical protein
MMNGFSRFSRFFERCVAVDGRVSVGAEGRMIHDALMRSIEASNPGVEGARQPSMCHDGTPLVYSVKLGHPVPDAFRVLVEPGSLRDGVARQIAFSLTVVDQLLSRLSWHAAASDINTVTARVLPNDVEAADRCWGGIWLGASIPQSSDCDRESELRMYFNLRHGDTWTRWRRLKAILTTLAPEGEQAHAMAWVETTSTYTRPVGVALVVAKGRVRGCRIYAVTSPQALTTLVSLQQVNNGRGISEFCAAFERTFGLPPSVTVGYDFENTEAGLRPAVARTKVDLCCQLMEPARKHEIVPWIAGVLRRWNMTTVVLDRFVADLKAEWGQFDVEFVGVGVTRDTHHVTMYAKPHIGH